MAEGLGRTPSGTAVRAFLGVDGAYLAAAFDAITAEHGSIEAYLARLGVDTRAAGQLREIWLEPNAA